MVTNYEGEQIQIPDNLPMLPVRDIVVFPFMVLPLFVGRDSSIKAVEEADARNDHLIFLSSQKNTADEQPQPDSIYNLGTVAMIVRKRKLPDGRIKILAQGISKATIKDYTQQEPFFRVNLERVEEISYQPPYPVEVEAVMRTSRENVEKIISLGKALSPEILMLMEEIQDPSRLADLIGANLGLKMSEAQSLLEMTDAFQRMTAVNDILVRELEVLMMQAKIRSQAKDEMTKSQKEYYLREQIRAIKNELGDSDNKQEEFGDIRQKVIDAHMGEENETEILKQLSRLERMHPDSSEASILRNYIELIVDLPWSKGSKDNLDIKHAKAILDEDHFDLHKIKERVLEYLAVRKLNNKMKGPILCFSGPPGVGKTSLGRSIARALGRNFMRMSLGGVKDEAEIRGHRRTYVGAMPGKIIQSIKQAKSNNPVILLDEIDKLGNDFRGDPASALLEVLDPEQNHTFRDHYLNLPFDLSNVLFLATANVLETIPAPLRDRMEIIQLSGYTEDEKLKIGRQYLVSKQAKENGISEKEIDISDAALRFLIENYTREAGLRNLERQVGAVCRKVARKIAEGEETKISVTPAMVEKMLGPPHYTREDAQDRDEVGVSTGLAWTQVGGEILYIETTKYTGKGGIILTGQMGDVMKESATAAMSYIRANAARYGIDEKEWTSNEVHVHLPAGAIPKDGPSAGIAMATAIISRLTGVPVRRDIAMTGELTLTGKILPIGGLKEKSLAAMRLGITKIIIPFKNVKDLEDINEEYRNKLEFLPVKHLDEVLELALAHSVIEGGVTSSGSSGKKKKASAPRSDKDRAALGERGAA